MEPGSSPAARESRPCEGRWRQSVNTATSGHKAPGLSVTWGNETRDLCIPGARPYLSDAWCQHPDLSGVFMSRSFCYIPRVT